MTTGCFLNPRVQRVPIPRNLRLPSPLRARYASWLAGWSRVLTPPRSFPAQAERLGLGGLALKDEGRRSMLGSFKALGAPVALVAEVLRRHPLGRPRRTCRVLCGCPGGFRCRATMVIAGLLLRRRRMRVVAA